MNTKWDTFMKINERTHSYIYQTYYICVKIKMLCCKLVVAILITNVWGLYFS